MTFDFIVDTYETERLKTLSVWSQFRDDDLVAPAGAARAHSRIEHMVHQCVSEDTWMIRMLGIDVGWPQLPVPETRLGFISHYAEATRRPPRAPAGLPRRMVRAGNRLLRRPPITGLGAGAANRALGPSSWAAHRLPPAAQPVALFDLRTHRRHRRSLHQRRSGHLPLRIRRAAAGGGRQRRRLSPASRAWCRPPDGASDLTTSVPGIRPAAPADAAVLARLRYEFRAELMPPVEVERSVSVAVHALDGRPAFSGRRLALLARGRRRSFPRVGVASDAGEDSQSRG